MQLAETERYLSKTLLKHGINEKDFGRIRSVGGSRLFGGFNTMKMKERLEIKKSRVLADYLPTISIKVKDFAAALTNHKIYNDNINGLYEISNEHKPNNTLIRRILIKKNIYPEVLPILSNQDSRSNITSD
ncbi:MAG: hypothetical protein EOP33_07695 [Rickettsiaceae bacterium]|nr:MAG: hypothetical protein EOP33_07695 [Rickettsiaceae bacterium]